MADDAAQVDGRSAELARELRAALDGSR